MNIIIHYCINHPTILATQFDFVEEVWLCEECKEHLDKLDSLSSREE